MIPKMFHRFKKLPLLATRSYNPLLQVPDVIEFDNGLVAEPCFEHGAPSTARHPYHLIVFHYKGDTSLIVLDTPYTVHRGQPRWTVENYNPLTLSPSLDFKDWNLHGYVKNGRWT